MGLLAAWLLGWPLMASVASGVAQSLCERGMDSPAPDIGGGPVNLGTEDPAACQALCDDTEHCDSWVIQPRSGGCLPPNLPNGDNRSAPHTNLPPDWPAAKCFLKAPPVPSPSPPPALRPDNCTCTGKPSKLCSDSTPTVSCLHRCGGAIAGFQPTTCGQRRGFTLPDAAGIVTESPLACARLCAARSDCTAWSYTSCNLRSGRCWLKNLVGEVEIEDFSCTAVKLNPPSPPLPPSSLGNFTPWGYIQNPYHRARHRSGNLRMHDRLNGLGLYFSGDAPHDPDTSANSATLLVSPIQGKIGPVLANTADFMQAGVERYSHIHTKSRIGVSHTVNNIKISATYYQVNERVFGAQIEAETVTAAQQESDFARFGVLVELDSGQKNVSLSSTGSTSTMQASVGGLGDFAFGVADCTPLASMADPTLHGIKGLLIAAAASVPPDDTAAFPTPAPPQQFDGYGPRLYLAFLVEVPLFSNGSIAHCTPLLSRGSPGAGSYPAAARSALASAINSTEWINQWNRAAAQDYQFWDQAIRLEGGWPPMYKRGVQYDFNTVRSNIRPATGIFRHQWDAMQVHTPRIVVAESSMDMMTMSYGDVELAKEVLYGLYEDSMARGFPQVPCGNEDGTMDMECMDNNTCGTPPSWGAPLFTVYSIYQRTGDKMWLQKIYPAISGYLNFWLANRTDTDGYQICVCTWESGQDMMLRWGWNQVYGGDRSARIIRAPEHQAAMAYSAGVMAYFSAELKLDDSPFWINVRNRHVNFTKSLYNHQARWFCDYNSEAKVWQSGCNDVGPPNGTVGAGKQTYQLAPLFFHNPDLGVNLIDANTMHIDEMLETVFSPKMFGSDPPGSLTFDSYCTQSPVDPRCVTDIWAPHPWIIIAAAGNFDHNHTCYILEKFLDRVWGKMDARERLSFPPTPSPFGRSSSQGSPYPGSSYECLSKQHCSADDRSGSCISAMQQSCGSEEYAWTAEATTVAFIREIVGFRELSSSEHPGFLLRPRLTERLRSVQEPLVVRGLTYQKRVFDVTYMPQQDGSQRIDVTVQESTCEKSSKFECFASIQLDLNSEVAVSLTTQSITLTARTSH